MTDERQTIAALLARRREALDLSDEEAGAQLGVSQSTFNRWRTGRFVPTDDRLSDIAAWLQLREDTVALAMSDGRRARPPIDDDVKADLAAELRELRLRVERLEREADPDH